MTRIRPPSSCRPVVNVLESLSLRIGYAKRMLVAVTDRGNGSRLYEVNIWTWHYDGRGRPRMVSIVEAERIRSERVLESRIRTGETRKWHSEQAGSGAAGGSAG